MNARGERTLQYIVKRDGRITEWDPERITRAVDKAMQASHQGSSEEARKITEYVTESLHKIPNETMPDVETIQDIVEETLMRNGFEAVARKYILYRASRTRIREMNTDLMRIYDEITHTDAGESNLKRDNANVDGDTAMGTMLKYGCEGAKDYNKKYLLSPEQATAHHQGDIHIHDFDFYSLTTTCCQIDLQKLFHGGFSTGHGFLREPNDIQSYAALACIAIQSNQNDQHGGQSIANFDYDLAEGVRKTYRRLYLANLEKALQILQENAIDNYSVKELANRIETQHSCRLSMGHETAYFSAEFEALAAKFGNDIAYRVQDFAIRTTYSETERAVFQAMEALVHNLNTMHSRAGAQTPFSSINYGTDITPEGRMVIRNILLATEAGLGNGETPIFPIQIFRVKEGVNYHPTDPNFDLFQLACRVSAKRLFPNFSFLDAPFNLSYYRPGRPETEVAYMGCRTRVIGNVYDRNNEVVTGRGNLSFTSINLPRLAIESHGNESIFYEKLHTILEIVAHQLRDRYEIQAKKKLRNFPFLMGQGIWLDSEKLGPEDEIREVLKHGTLSIGFIGLAETLVALYGHHHGESDAMQEKGLQIVQRMREFTDIQSAQYNMNYTLLATPAEGLSGRFLTLDQERYGTIPGVTDHDYYTNSFHIPVYYEISAYDKIRKESPYHALTNAGHISYVELDGDTARNPKAFETIVRAMHDLGVGYGSINHPVDRDPVCGYNGIIEDVCPRCGRTESDGGPKFERIRRITGYLVGTLERFNDAKRAEESERVHHGFSTKYRR